MKFKSIELTHFRNYEKLIISLNSSMTVFVGENGQGKTNLLEALSFFSDLRSFRTNKETDLIQQNQEYAFLKAVVANEVSEKKISIFLGKNGKSISVDNNLVKKASQFIGTINTILFTPSDLVFFDTSPRERRRFIDLELSKISPTYLMHINQYQTILKERNALLKNNQLDKNLFDVLTEKLVDHGAYLRSKRNDFIQRLSIKTNHFYNIFSKQKCDIQLVYRQDCYHASLVELKKSMLQVMHDQFERDRLFKMTHCGVHRDDILCLFNQHELSSYASQGQKRLVIIAMKLALVEIILDINKQHPILLLDDVLSELDAQHQQRLLDNCPKSLQTIVTSTQLDFIDKLVEKPKIYYIHQAKIL